MVDYSKWDKIDFDESDINEVEESQQATPSISIADIDTVSEGDKPLVELMQHVQSMDCDEAYKQLCLAQDEIKRLQQLELEDGVDITLSTTQQLSVSSKDIVQSETSDTVPQINKSIPQASQVDNTISTRNNEHNKPCAISGSWLNCQDDSNKLCSIEYLPNVKCYQITLLSNQANDIPKSKEELQFDMISITNEIDQSVVPTVMSYYEAKLYRLKVDRDKEWQLLLSVTLPISSTSNESLPTARISLDTNSISTRIQHNLLSMVEMDDSFDIVDNLLGIELSSFASVTTNPNDLNYLHCRTCQNPIITPPSAAAASSTDNTIQSVLPLPTGYWDDISDYLICYDGQAIVDFTSSTTTAIKQSALEDDAVLVLHQDDLIQNQQRRGIRIGRVKGYGEHSSGNEDAASSSEAWKDKAAIKGAKSKTITCANCCSTLGFVSNNDNDSNTYRLYKHLLDCGKPPNTSIFSKYTCGSFLAREMVRYAENDAIYTFIVGISDEMDWTRAHNPGPCILIRMLSWDTPMAIVDKKSTTDESNELQFHKVVKVIFEEVSDKSIDTTNNNGSTEWTWRGVDFCCPPPNGTSVDETASSEMQTKASRARIFFSQQEWIELKDTLANRSMYFSDDIKEAVVMTKLGLPTSDEEKQKAALSFLSLVS